MSDFKISGGNFQNNQFGDTNQTTNISGNAQVGAVNQQVGARAAEIDAGLAELTKLVGELVKQLPPRQAQQVQNDLKTLETEAKSEAPRRGMFDVTAKGLIEAATAVAGMMGPVTSTVQALGQLLFS